MTHSRPAIHDLLDKYGLAARREFGQNFVADPNTVRRIAELSGVGGGDLAVEIGPGLGSLTLALVETGADVVAVEVDPGLASAASEILSGRARIIEGDALTISWDEVIGDHAGDVHVVSNLPYNIGTTLILDILADQPRVSSQTVLVQAEVADRLAASPGSKTYGIPSVLAAVYADVTVVAKVPPTVFVPRPKVMSAVVKLTRRSGGVDVAHNELRRVLQAGFGQRRKMLRRSLSSVLTVDQIESVDVEPTARAEEIDVVSWVRLASLLS